MSVDWDYGKDKCDETFKKVLEITAVLMLNIEWGRLSFYYANATKIASVLS